MSDATEPVFVRMASEFTWLLGAEVYSALRVVLDQVWAERDESRRESAPAEGGHTASGDRRE